MHKTRYTLKERVCCIKQLGENPWRHGSNPAVSLVFGPARGKTGTEPHTPDMVDGNNLNDLTAATPLEENPWAVTGNEPPPRTCFIGRYVFG